MNDSGESDGPSAARPLQPIAEYKMPGMPTDVATKRLIGWAWRQVREPEGPEPFIAESNLNHVTGRMLREVAGPPACGPLMHDFDEHFRSLLAGADGLPRVHLVLLPPGDQSDLLGRFASNHGLDALPLPPRSSLLEPQDTLIEEVVAALVGQSADGDNVLVNPQLERWFLRHECGLALVRRLFDLIDVSQRRIIVGCSTWAWDFLCKAAQANMVLPSGITFERFGATELHDWFAALEVEGGSTCKIRLASNGADLFSEKSATNRYFYGLAAESLGIPWVAWHRWRRSLRYKHASAEDANAKHQTEQNAVDDDAEGTFWVSSLPTFSLPPEHLEPATLVLQAILIHGGLNAEELRQVVPVVGELRIVSSLIAAGYVRRGYFGMQIVPTVYPEIRRELISDGFPHPPL